MKRESRFEGYNLASLRKDLIAGILVGVIAIPLGMAFAIASGVKPEYGIYTTIVAGTLISLLGGSKFQIGGPTGAFIPILFAIGARYGYENLLIAGLMAGVILVLMGLLRLGGLIRFIPKPVTVGFTAGIAVIIFTGQIASFLGLRGVRRHEAFLGNMHEVAIRLGTVNGYSVATACICLAVLLAAARFAPKLPGSLLGLVAATLAASLCFPGQVATIGTAYGDIPSTLPAFHVPAVTWDRIVLLIRPALLIALLGAIESLLSAVVADGMTGSRHDSNRELIGQGIANICAPLFGGIPATGAIARTATNIRSGAASPVSGVVHGAAVLLILLAMAPYASRIPLAAMAPILMMVAWNMSERKDCVRLLKTRTGDSLVLAVTFLLTVFTDLPTAVEAGLALAVLLFVKRMGEAHGVAKALPDPESVKVLPQKVSAGQDCPQIGIYNVEGPLFFGTANRFGDALPPLVPDGPKAIILRMGRVPLIDLTGESHLAEWAGRVRSAGGRLLISGIQPQPLELLKKSGLYDRIGAANFCAHTEEAILSAQSGIDRGQCSGCRHAAFRECGVLSGSEGRLRQGLTGYSRGRTAAWDWSAGIQSNEM
ncbi:SulP family inorganic anion transporter [Paenibacillus glufosinatiresistens]|uniref:SulP family inorganic anion transporter n=1 Tax=Paenibacillus glufosinatiresistens TaxID=3070657 RepID=UPI00286EA092|nr:SulP family inorganic anion transporter [Paenibacillus sp. YX.27]